jgi:hypothetical protein
MSWRKNRTLSRRRVCYIAWKLYLSFLSASYVNTGPVRLGRMIRRHVDYQYASSYDGAAAGALFAEWIKTHPLPQALFQHFVLFTARGHGRHAK